MRGFLRRTGAGEEGRAYARARLQRRSTPWLQAEWCALDFELTGLHPREDEIVSFGAIPIHQGRLQLRDAVSRLVRAPRESSEAAIRVHGIRTIDLAELPPLADAIAPLLRAITGRVLVVHTAAVERAFLRRALRAQRLRLRGPIVDTEELGRLWLHDAEGSLRRHLSLTELATALGLPSERPHDALGDAQTTAQVFIALAAHLDSVHAETVGTLSRASRRLDALGLLHGQ